MRLESWGFRLAGRGEKGVKEVNQARIMEFRSEGGVEKGLRGKG